MLWTEAQQRVARVGMATGDHYLTRQARAEFFAALAARTEAETDRHKARCATKLREAASRYTGTARILAQSALDAVEAL